MGGFSTKKCFVLFGVFIYLVKRAHLGPVAGLILTSLRSVKPFEGGTQGARGPREPWLPSLVPPGDLPQTGFTLLKLIKMRPWSLPALGPQPSAPPGSPWFLLGLLAPPALPGSSWLLLYLPPQYTVFEYCTDWRSQRRRRPLLTFLGGLAGMAIRPQRNMSSRWTNIATRLTRKPQDGRKVARKTS